MGNLKNKIKLIDTENIIGYQKEKGLRESPRSKRKGDDCVMTGGNYCGNHFVAYTNVKLLFCIPETNTMSLTILPQLKKALGSEGNYFFTRYNYIIEIKLTLLFPCESLFSSILESLSIRTLIFSGKQYTKYLHFSYPSSLHIA